MSRQVQAIGRPRACPSRCWHGSTANGDSPRRGCLVRRPAAAGSLLTRLLPVAAPRNLEELSRDTYLVLRNPRDDTSALLQRRHTEDVAPQLSVLAVGDPRRPLIRRAVFGTIWAAAVFFVFTATKEVKTVYGHSPWLNDPYDTVISFTMFFVPLVTACLLAQVSLCLRSEPLSTARVVAVVRGCRVAVGAVVVDLASAWLAVFLGANESHWSLAATGTEIGLLGLATAVAITAVVHLVRVPRLPGPVQPYGPGAPDWLGDAVTVVRRESRRLRPLRRIASGAADWAEQSVVQRARRHPIGAAAIASAVFGVTVFGWQGYREGYFLPVTLLAMALGFCAMFAFLVPAGSYFGLVRSSRPSYGVQRRVIDASVAGCAAAIAALAFRNSLWWVVGSTPGAAGPSRLAALTGGAVLVAFLVVAVLETVLHWHAQPVRRR